MKRIYTISGLGADERVFRYLNLGEAEVQNLEWKEPLPGEHLRGYVRRLAEDVEESEKSLLLGVSFGGVVAVELAKILPFKKVIIISSVKKRSELPLVYRMAGRLRLTKLVPSFMLSKYMWITGFMFGVKTVEEKQLLRQIIEETNGRFAKWALGEISRWDNKQDVPGLVHIHGTADRLLPVRRIRDAVTIEDGAHFMIVSRAGEVGEVIGGPAGRVIGDR
ncbi:MAG: alpha/beta hydrolase [bacterium]|nr:alpha/beta hydrolase [bacterium]